MFQRRFLFLAVSIVFAASFCSAQSALLDLPRKSQNAEVSQTIGITDVTLKYSRPLANGRKVFGGLVPYNDVWRAGANENTTITFTDPVSIEGHALDKGTYALFMIPTESDWTIIFSKMNTAWGAFSYKQDEDALRVTVKPATSDFHDALVYEFDNLKPDSAVLTLRWDKVAVPVKCRSTFRRRLRQACKSSYADACNTSGRATMTQPTTSSMPRPTCPMVSSMPTSPSRSNRATTT